MGVAIPPAPAVPARTRISARLKRVQGHSSPVNVELNYVAHRAACSNYIRVPALDVTFDTTLPHGARSTGAHDNTWRHAHEKSRHCLLAGAAVLQNVQHCQPKATLLCGTGHECGTDRICPCRLRPLSDTPFGSLNAANEGPLISTATSLVWQPQRSRVTADRTE